MQLLHAIIISSQAAKTPLVDNIIELSALPYNFAANANKNYRHNCYRNIG